MEGTQAAAAPAPEPKRSATDPPTCRLFPISNAPGAARTLRPADNARRLEPNPARSTPRGGVSRCTTQFPAHRRFLAAGLECEARSPLDHSGMARAPSPLQTHCTRRVWGFAARRHRSTVMCGFDGSARLASRRTNRKAMDHDANRPRTQRSARRVRRCTPTIRFLWSVIRGRRQFAERSVAACAWLGVPSTRGDGEVARCA